MGLAAALLLGGAGRAAEVWTADVGLSPGTSVDVVPWGERASWAEGRDLGVWWEDPRDIERVVVTFADAPPDPATVRLEWWHSRWPEHRIPRDQPAGAGESGWGHLGDLYQGEWREADVYFQADGRTWTYTFRHVNLKEFPELRDFNAEYRTTLRLRLLFDGPAPAVERLAAYTDSVWRSGRFAIEWVPEAGESHEWHGRLEMHNGYAAKIERMASAAAVAVGHDGAWSFSSAGQSAGILVDLWYTVSPNMNTFDGTVATARMGRLGFSFSPAEASQSYMLYMPHARAAVSTSPSFVDLPVALIERHGLGGSLSLYHAALSLAERTNAPSLYRRVFAEPEQTLARALAEQPPKPGRIYLPLGTEGGRQRFGVNPDGSVFCVNDRIDQPRGRDTARRRWGAQRLEYDFALPKGEPVKRWIEDECLPILHTQWERDGIRYTQTAFVTRLDPGGLGFPDMRADDTAVLVVKVHGQNIASEYRLAHATLSLRADGRRLPVTTRKGRLYAQHPDGDRLRAVVEVQGSVTGTVEDGEVHFAGHMPPGTDGHMVLRIPFITLEEEEEIQRLEDLEYVAEFRRVKAFWKGRADASTQITTPIAELNNFYRAHVSHLLINCGREVGADRMGARVGSFSYGVFGNESCMMITDLDRRGLHAEAERCLETFLHYQGTVALPGDYASQEGVFNGAGGWEQGGYNQHHGWILWAMAEHYWYTGDRAWLRRNASALMAACAWIAHERDRTRELTGRRAIERGLLPPGSLEDIGDWRNWLSNNVFSWWGMQAVARALEDVEHPQAAPLREEVEAYRRDILAAFEEASLRAPLVPLRDGTWVPQIPSEVHRRGRTFGWITATLEGPIYLLRTGLLAPDHPMAVPILQDYEDNLYLSDRYGYSWEKHGAQWFSRGGISMQPNLLCSPHPYLLRDEIKHFLRAYFNGFAACYYPDTQMLCEHPLPDLGDWRGDHYKSSDEANSAYWLRLMFIEDDRGDDVLRLGMALPRAWLADGEAPAIERAATHFGPMSLRFRSEADQGRIRAVVDLPVRRVPRQTLLRFRHPEGKPVQRVEVNGRAWDRFDAAREWVDLTSLEGRLEVTAHY
ncbi:MAG: hypothetical protein HS113_30505 [Verrucomicrobiales bacterium]|nr:hypothetical protein [Verrucomicrobiales bacterium]